MEKNQNHLQLEGIILALHPYLDDREIVHLFTKEKGLISVFARKGKKQGILSIFSHGLFQIIEKSNSFRLQEFFPISLHLYLRKDLKKIQTANLLSQAILYSHLEEQLCSKSYILLSYFLNHLSEALYPANLSISFLGKLLKLEGIAQFSTNCISCGNRALQLENGQSFCQKHLKDLILFTPLQWIKICHLVEANRFSDLQKEDIGKETAQKMWTLFCTHTR